MASESVSGRERDGPLGAGDGHAALAGDHRAIAEGGVARAEDVRSVGDDSTGDKEGSKDEEQGQEEADEGVRMRKKKKKRFHQSRMRDVVCVMRSMGTIPYLPDPYLTVDAGRPLMLPLSHPDAQRIIAASHPAPFGRGNETIIDQSVRKTWELNCDQLNIHNPAFQTYIANALRDSCKGLGLESHVGVTEKAPGMFGTMIISLPSCHEGGTIELSHSGMVKQFSTSRQAGASTAAWYSDVRHEIKPVTSGFRLVLTFNLVQAAALGQSYASGFALRYPILEEAASISLQTLKADDLAKAQALQHFATENQLVLYLASCEKEVSGDAEADDYEEYRGNKRRRWGWDEDDYGARTTDYHEITNEMESSITLQRLVDVHGTELARDIVISEEDFLQDDPYEDRDPTAHEYEGYTGNAGATATHWYRDTVIVLVRRQDAVEFLLHGAGNLKDIRPMLTAQVKTVASNLEDEQAYADVLTICHHIFSRKHYKQDTIEYAFRVLIWFITIDRAHVSNLDRAIKGMPGVKLSTPSLKEIGKLVGVVDAAQLAPIINLVVTPFNTLGERLEALKAILGPGLERVDSPPLRSLVLTSVQQVVADALAPGSSQGLNGGALAEIALLGPTAALFREAFDRLILPTVHKNASNTHFAVSFLAVWGSKGHLGFDQDHVVAVYMVISDIMIAAFHIDFKDPPKPQVQHRYLAPPAPPPQDFSQQYEKFAQDLSTVWLQAAAKDMPLDFATFLRIIARDVRIVKADLIRNILLPCLRLTLADSVNRLHDPLSSEVSHAYAEILVTFLLTFVKEQPQDSSGLSRRKVNCVCNACFHVNVFLASSTQQTLRIKMDKDNRQHVHIKLDSGAFDGTHITDRSYREPQTMVITKRDRGRQVYDAWLTRCRTAHQELQKFDAEALHQVIPLAYDYVMTMECLDIDDARRPDFLPAKRRSVPPPAQPDLAGGQRNAAVEVVDLCGDSD
ncbi:hypothetical protein LTR97_002392 [Elasticomyces elasticus]|uniref:Prolyl 4-hydroxylase alpha subunit Fe(2+) 2OG dioxygenase domain-containing protein n=1 Tax=Elasticomyces elasticus TaxID=574655 RepID=A0AAN7WAV9_9PEZI|nr:hypothetical protein LTR97_002392 [Elasticomyces elasticus]